MRNDPKKSTAPAKAEITARNRKNARRSTGPRTTEGKMVVSRNALSHGLTALAPVIPGEDPAAYLAHTAAVVADRNATGIVETHLAEDIAWILWRLKRVARFEAAVVNTVHADAENIALTRQMKAGIEDTSTESRLKADDIRQLCVLPRESAMGRIITVETFLRRSLSRALAELRQLQESRPRMVVVLREAENYKTKPVESTLVAHDAPTH